MPRSSDDDAPRWELPVWEPPADSPSDEIPRWEPEREVPRWQPQPGLATRARGSAPNGVSAAPTTPAVPSRRASPVTRPFAWWGAHPWIVVWTLVFLAPAVVVALRALDESGQAALVRPLAWGLTALLGVALTLAMLTTAGRSITRLTLGTVGALAVLAGLLWPTTQVTLGRTMCPPRAGDDLGVPVATAAIDAWQHGVTGDEGWRRARTDDAWRDRSRAVTALAYELVETGCWERVAPIDATRTWHEFRVTVRDGTQAALSKSVVVHTAMGSNGWKITAIEGPLP